MGAEQNIDSSSLEQALFWRGKYREILAMEEGVMARVRELMEAQSQTVPRETELSNVPVIAAQLERFRSGLGYWGSSLAATAVAGHRTDRVVVSGGTRVGCCPTPSPGRVGPSGIRLARRIGIEEPGPARCPAPEEPPSLRLPPP